ncbi:MAG TPA: DUF6443 domain-containing protein [Ohtaekwangia sp.]|uniref:DUF6443 domain-containing protein n=1 Tax=Ohtaekwangia sp. TaxID=2066019 RepID=UPI002F92E9F9
MKKNIILVACALLISSSISLFGQCTLPVITTQPVNVVACEGGTVSLSVQATNATSYQWYWNGSSGSEIVPPLSPPWSGNTTNTLTISLLSSSMTGQYWVKVTNTCGTVTSNVVVVSVVQTGTVAFSETALSVANNGLMCPGSTINFSSPGSLSSYSWTGPNNFTSNVQNPSIANATTAMTGVYTLTSANGKGCVYTGSISVVFNSSPTINSQPADVTVCDGVQTTLTINATGNGNTYQWYWSGSSSGGGIVPPLSPPWSGQQTKTLTLSPTAPAMAGQYWVKITNACGTITSSAANVIVDKPTVTLTSTPSIVCAGGAFTFQATPNGMSAYSWSGPNGFTSTKQNPSVSSAVSGNYTLTVTTASGCTASATAVIDAKQVTPTIAISSNPDWCADGKAVLTATITNGGSSPSYQWFVNGAAVAGATGNTYVSSVLNNEKISCTLTSNAVCTTSATAVSNVITISRCETNSMNYVRSRNVLKDNVFDAAAIEGLSVEDLQESTTYFDGLGRPVQTVSWQSSPSHKDQVQPIEYDIFGREEKKYLPYTSENNGRYKETSTKSSGTYTGSPQNTFYTNGSSDHIADDIAPYAETIFESSPLNRIIKQGASGTVWQPDGVNTYNSSDHTIKKNYESNTDNEVLLWTYTDPSSTYPLGQISAGTSASRVYYTANQLYRNRTKDEHGNEVIEYVDKEGHTILKRVQVVKNATAINDVNYASTYYIYDDLGDLVTVIPPEAVRQITSISPSAYFDQTDAVKEAFLQQWAFRYTYDSRKRMTQKQVPGAAAVYMVYDDRDRLVLTQDGNQRANMQWTFTKYDELNRPIATGIKDTTAILSQADMQAGVAKHYAKSWTRYGETYIGNVAGNISGYSNKSYPTVTVGLATPFSSYRTITYYDNYAFKSYIGTGYDYLNENLSEPANGYTYTQPSTAFNSVIGQVTGTRVRVLDDHIASSVVTWLNSVNYYDDKYRVIQVLADNYRSGRDRVSNVYDFSGKVLKTKATHYGISWKDIVAARRLGNRIDKTSVDGWGNSGGASVEMLPAGQDGWFEFSTSANNKALVVGLSETNVDANWTTIKYALYLTSLGKLEVRESGGTTNLMSSSPAYTAGDVFRIERKQGRIYFYQNGTYLADRAATSNALLIDFAMYGNRAVIGNVRSSFGSFNPYQITRRYTYDHAGRLTHTWHKIGTQPEILLSKNEYNELGQLVDKKLHSTNAGATDAKQSVDYRYNIRGWLTSMNNAELNNDGITNDETGDYFGMNLAYNEDMGTGRTNTGSSLKDVLVSSYPFTGNANDAVANGLNGVVHGAQLTTDSQGNSASAYTFTTNDYIDIPNSQTKHSFIPNTGKFTIAAFVKITDLNARSVFVSNTATSSTKGFAFMYETYGAGYGDHQLRFIIMTGNGATAYFTGLGGVRTINDTNWHHVAVVGDGVYIRFYVDGVLDGAPVAITAFSTGAMSSTTLIGKTRSGASGPLFLGMAGSIDEVNILNRPASQSEIQALANRSDFDSSEDGRQYNGNISAMKWSVNQGIGDVKEMAYNFKYDPLNRLVSAKNLQSSVSGTWTAGKYHEGDLSYDLNGNIKTLSRFGLATSAMDNLSYTYATGNQLTKVADTGDKYAGFVDGVNTDNDYAYDANGNMTIDKNKGITAAITYNTLNLPNTVTRGLNSVNYIYDATGHKLAQATYFLNSTTQTDYAGEFQYVNDALQFIQHEEGRVVLATEKLVYTNDGSDLTSVTAYNGTTISAVKLSGNQDYIKVLSNGTTLRGAMFGGVLPAQPGERYRIKIKGYRVGNNNVNILARTNMGDLLWGSYWNGSQMPASSTTESWIEETVTIPTGGTQLEVGLQWGAAAATDYFVVSGVEVTKLGTNTTPEYQYSLKDHLGNVRLTFTTKKEKLQYTAKFEDSSEAQNFKNYSSVSADMFDHTDAGTVYTKAQVLKGGPGSQVGIAKTFAVVPGDTVKAEVYAKYLGTQGSAVDPTTFGAALLSAFNLAAPAAGEAGTASAALSDYGAFIGGNGNPGNANWPKGWLNILVFDKDYNLIDVAFQQLSADYVQEVGSVTKAPHGLLSKQVTIKQPGYVYIYVSNEGSVAQEVYFDDLSITHVKSPVIQAEDYYPFGLTCNQYQRENSVTNQYQYNEKEFQDELNLVWLDYDARMYMPEIGKWMSLDPLAVIQEEYSPYTYVYNNPIGFSDPSGMIGESQSSNSFTVVASTFVDSEGMIIDHRDDGDPYIYLVMDPNWKRGDSKRDLPVLGIEEQGKKYEIFGKVDLSKPEQKRAYATGALEPDFTLESLAIPFARPIGWGLSWAGNAAVRLVSKGGKWVFELFEVGTGKVIQEAVVKGGKLIFTETAKEGDLLFYSTKIGDDVIEFGGNFSKSDGTLIIKNFDVDGAITNKLGIRGIKNLITDFGRQQGVSQVIIQGAKRTTGANPGKIPSQLIFKID